jgi:tetratricopeptide (TPR) repeat protein
MKKLLINLAVGLGVLLVIGALVGLFVRGKSKSCWKDASPEAIEACSFLINCFPSNSMRAKVIMQRAGQYSEIDSYRNGINDYNALLKFNESKQVDLTVEELREVYEGLAILNSKLHYDKETLKYVNDAIQNGSKNSALYMIKGEINLKRKKYSKALLDFKIAEKLKLNTPELHFNFGVIYSSLRKYKDAYRSLKKVDTKKFCSYKLIEYHKLLGASANKLFFYEEARSSFQKVLDINYDADCARAIRDIDKYLGTLEFKKPTKKPIKK